MIPAGAAVRKIIDQGSAVAAGVQINARNTVWPDGPQEEQEWDKVRGKPV